MSGPGRVWAVWRVWTPRLRWLGLGTWRGRCRTPGGCASRDVWCLLGCASFAVKFQCGLAGDCRGISMGALRMDYTAACIFCHRIIVTRSPSSSSRLDLSRRSPTFATRPPEVTCTTLDFQSTLSICDYLTCIDPAHRIHSRATSWRNHQRPPWASEKRRPRPLRPR